MLVVGDLGLLFAGMFSGEDDYSTVYVGIANRLPRTTYVGKAWMEYREVMNSIYAFIF